MRVIKWAKLHVNHQKVFVKLGPSNSSHSFSSKEPQVLNKKCINFAFTRFFTVLSPGAFLKILKRRFQPLEMVLEFLGGIYQTSARYTTA